MTLRRIPFSLLLPILSVLLWVCLVAAPTTVIYAHYVTQAHGAQPLSLWDTMGHMDLPRSRFLSFAAFQATYLSRGVLPALNVPGFTLELLISRLTYTWPSIWHPHTMLPEAWRAISWPFYCLPFWWIEGVGIDALLKRRQPRWPWLLAGTLLCIVFIVLAVGLTIAMREDTTDGATMYYLYGFYLWSILLMVYPAAWIRRFRSARQATRA